MAAAWKGLYVLFIAQLVNFWTFMNIGIQNPGFIQRIVRYMIIQKFGFEID